jgi:hypothetical protein
MSNSHSKTNRIDVRRLIALAFALALLSIALLPGRSPSSAAPTPPEKRNMRKRMNGAKENAPNATMMTPMFAAITVDRTDDPSGAALTLASACTAAANDCSLRGAVAFANLNPATTINVPAGTYNLTISGAGEGFSGNNSIGDVDIRGNNTSIIGAGSATTIIHQTTAGDRVVEVNPDLLANFVTSISGVTISGGTETTAVGGGGIISGSIGNSLTLSNCVISGNSATGLGTLGGGGVSHEGGNLTITNCTFSGNSTSGSGGAVGYTAGDPLIRVPAIGALVVSGSTFSGNTSTSGGGGALDLFNFNLSNGTYGVSTSSFSGNSASAGRGGAIIVESGPLTLTTSSLSGNSAAFQGGALYNSGNTAITFSRLASNSATLGSQVFSVNTIITAENNWWGNNAGPTGNDFRNTSGPVTPSLWLELQASASPTPICSGSSSTISADIKKRNAGVDLTVELNGLPTFAASFVNANPGVGNISGATNFVNGAASATFNGTANGTANIDVTADSQTVTASVTVESNTTSDPADQAVCQGDTATFSTTGGGPGPFHYSWTVDGSPFDGDNSSINVDTTGMSFGAHTVSVTTTGACGSASQSATLTVNSPTTTTDPADQTVCEGATANFSTTAGGTGPFHYAWTVDGSPSGGDSPTLNVNTTGFSATNHTVSVTTTGACGSASQSATLTVQATTTTTDPADQTVCAGATASFSTTAGGTGPFSYAWTVDGNAAGNTPSINVDTTGFIAGPHTVSVTTTGTCGSASQSATLTVQASTTTTDPADQTVCQGATASFSTTAGGTGPFSYSWTVDGNAAGGNSPSLNVNTTGLSVGNHTVSVTTTGTCGSASQSATLTVQATTTTTDPADQSVCEGATANFSTTAGGTGPFSYAWTVDGSPAGSNSPNLSVNTTGFSSGAHTVSVTTTGACGSASQSATLNVNNGSPTITVANSLISVWPPNHQYQNFTLADFGVTASSSCEGDLSNHVIIVSVTSDELDENPAGADGNTVNDIVIAGNCKSVQLRRERDADLDGRVYTVTFAVTDSLGHTTTATAHVTVPLNQNGGGAVDSGPHNTVNGTCP